MKYKKTVCIMAICDEETSPGVFYKYVALSSTPNDAFDITLKAYEPTSKIKYLNIVYDSLFCQYDIVMFRSNLQLSPLLCIIFFILKIKGIRVICEVPTPYYSHLKTTKNVFHILSYYFFAPILFFLCDNVVEYGNEGGFLKYFALKTKILANGIIVNDLNMKQESNVIKNKLNIVGAATLASWHGWDDVLQAISNVKEQGGVEVIFHVIGDGPEKNNLMALAETLNVKKNVIFYGMQSRTAVQSIYNLCQLGVGTFKWNEIALTEASPLKYREYTSVGLPFVYSTYDADYDNTNVAIMINEHDVTNDLTQKLLEIIHNNNLPTPIECRQYAYEKLDFSNKIDDLFT